MAIPSRNAHVEKIQSAGRVFFATTKTSMGQPLLQAERNARLLIEVLRTNVAARKFRLHDFVIMPDHVHPLLTLDREMTIEKAMQLIKGGFSFRLRKEFRHLGDVWQRGFSEVRADDEKHFVQCREYIAQNPIKAGLAVSAGQYPYCFESMAKEKASRG
jgi:putative transposase